MLNAWGEIDWASLKNRIGIVLALWVSYFLVIHLLITTLNRIVVPIVGIPLGAGLAVQGSLVLFMVLSYLLATTQADPRAGAAGFTAGLVRRR